MAQYTGKGHEVYMDSYYTSPAIANELANNDTSMCGTVNCKRRTELPLSKGDDPVFMRLGKLVSLCSRLFMGTYVFGNVESLNQVKAKRHWFSLTERHWLCVADDRPDCVVCSDRTRSKGRRQTKYSLCAVPCNERYHTLKNYKLCHLDT
ncbi:hypothetical protein M9458_052333 [Cirrhinus mrigala]|uniref:PiggyBac transposable element-derived protein domain-containing protein n=1 Tax=Cirrhinus mrigala TaxID=683832 RepID=A0ABD0MUF6_CIRMR